VGKSKLMWQFVLIPLMPVSIRDNSIITVKLVRTRLLQCIAM